MSDGYQPVLDFWFEELKPSDHWQKSAALDALIRRRFSALHRSACRCELWYWRKTVAGRLAEILLLDQFSRHIYRDQAEAFSADTLALCLAQEAVAAQADSALDPRRRAYLYMPFMHSESALIHEQALTLFSRPGLEENLRYERAHKAIIDRFGRYPHRNALLGRESTEEELAFLKQPGSRF